ncbi:hypothetical protein D9M72_453710 [compost metagenome]
MVRVRPRPLTAGHAPSGHLAANEFGDKLGRVSSPVAPDVHDQPVQCRLGIEVAVELGPAVRHHVRDVQVAVGSCRRFAYSPAVAGHPFLVTQALLVLDRHHSNAALPACGFAVGGSVAQGQLNSLPCGSDQLHGRCQSFGQLHAVNGEQDIPRLCVCAGPGQG